MPTKSVTVNIHVPDLLPGRSFWHYARLAQYLLIPCNIHNYAGSYFNRVRVGDADYRLPIIEGSYDRTNLLNYISRGEEVPALIRALSIVFDGHPSPLWSHCKAVLHTYAYKQTFLTIELNLRLIALMATELCPKTRVIIDYLPLDGATPEEHIHSLIKRNTPEATTLLLGNWAAPINPEVLPIRVEPQQEVFTPHTILQPIARF